MSRTSLDQYQIPLRSLGRGRRKPARRFSSSSNSGDADGSFTEAADDEDDRVSADEAPLIRKHRVFIPKATQLIQ